MDARPSAWRPDGPEVPIEFIRQSQNGCLTLVVDKLSAPSQVLWNELAVGSVEDAIEALRRREGNTRPSWIGRWPRGDEFDFAETIGVWAKSRGLDAVVWTALPSQFAGENDRRPSLAEALSYLAGLSGDHRGRAEEYVRKAPTQVNTAYRKAIEQCLGWTPLPV